MKGLRKFLMGIGTLAVIGVVLAGCGDLFSDPVEDTVGIEADNQIVITDAEDAVPTSVIAGGGQTFVAGYQGKTAGVFWSVAGLQLNNGVWTTGAALRPDTTVSGTGVLSVSLDESAKKLRVTATLSADTSVVGWVDIDRLDASETTVPLLQQLKSYLKSGSVTVREEDITITGDTNTEITVPSNSALVVPVGAKLVIKKGTTGNNPKITIGGKLIVKGELEIEDTVLASGRGSIIVESGGVYTDGNDPAAPGPDLVPFGFFLNGTTIVKGGGVLRTSDKVWNLGTPAGVDTFIGTPSYKGIIRLPPESTITIKVTNASAAKTSGDAPAFDFQLDGLVVVRGGPGTSNPAGPWTLGVNDIVTVTAGSILSLENTGELVLPQIAVTAVAPLKDSQLILTAAAGTEGAKIIGRGKITVGPDTTTSPPTKATEIVGGDGGWQAVGDIAKKHTVIIQGVVAGGTNTIKAAADASATTLPALQAGIGATITQKAEGTLTIAAGLTIKLGGTPTAKMGSIELEAHATDGGIITLEPAGTSVAEARIETGNTPGGGDPKRIQSTANTGALTGEMLIDDVADGGSTALATITTADASGDQYLATIGAAISGAGNVQAGTGSDVELSSETLVTVAK